MAFFIVTAMKTSILHWREEVTRELRRELEDNINTFVAIPGIPLLIPIFTTVIDWANAIT
jgi:hypothetical protein